MYVKQKVGKKGEELTCDYLVKNNYEIVEKNFRCKQGEIDIIAKDLINEDIVFIEVKTRKNENCGLPQEAVNINKQKHIFNVAMYYIYKNKIINSLFRFDVVAIKIGNEIKIEHIKNAFIKPR